MKIEITSSDEMNRYLVRRAGEVERILRDVMNDKTIVTAYADNGRDFMLTSIIGVDPATRSVYLDYGADEGMNALLRVSSEVVLTTSHDQVRVQFTAPGLEKTQYRQAPAFRVPLPEQLLRLQRREYYRLVTSVVNPIKCLIPTDAGDLEATVVDISIGGIGILAYQNDFPLHAGRVYAGCRLTLPGVGQFAVSLGVRSTFEVVLRNGRHSHRAGCQFIDLPASLETEIQRYIIRVDRERRTRFY
ncbi:MAG: flagellar brake protein [Thiobacillaceae bacterium]|jgi:c-di-GMP-binding flagellar brake protein YcgR|nr:flagellar brake protein [Thiobacillaceae bacterium]